MMAKLAIPFIWSLAIAVLIRLFSAWDHLPQRVAVHFGVSMQPNGWSSRSGMALLLVLAVVGHAALATCLILSVGRQAAIVAPLHMVVATVLVSAFWQMINFNAEGKPFQAIWIVVPVLLVIGFISTILLAALFRHPVG